MNVEPVTVTLLGPVTIERRGRPVPGLSGDVARAVLTVLVVAGRPVGRPELCALFWPDVPEARARQNARRIVLRLRRALPGRIAADRAGVAFVPAAGDVLVPAGAGATGHDAADPRPAPDLAATGDGRLASDLDGTAGPAFDAWLAARRSERRAAAAAAWTTAAVAEASLTTLLAAVRLAPLDEAPARALMRALGRAGRLAEALDTYDDVSRRLHAALGIGPSAATRDLRDRLVVAARRPRPHNLPPPAASGAPDDHVPDEAIDGLAAWIADPARRLVTVIHPDAERRRAWARAAVVRIAPRWLDGIVWVAGGPGAGAPLEDRLAHALLEVDGFAVPPAALGRWLAPLERLIVLDEDDVVAGDAAAAARLAAWLEAAPDLGILALASRPLGHVFEHRFVVPPP